MIVHEIAHKLDMRNGRANGMRRCRRQPRRKRSVPPTNSSPNV
ncbi:zinc-dependent peptidase [Thiolapillus sp.]